MEDKDMINQAIMFKDRFGIAHEVPKDQLKKISNKMACSLWSMGIPVCYRDDNRYIVACGINPFSRPNKIFYAWIDEESSTSCDSE